MRITRDILLKLARETVERRSRENHTIVAAYLCGSLVDGDFMLGGTTDIDLVIIHSHADSPGREIVPLTEEVHLDILHHLQKDYRQPRLLRAHPWLGPTLADCLILYDPQHLLDFTQASVRGQFDRPDRVMTRSQKLLDQARKIWLDEQTQPTPTGPAQVLAYLRALSYAANAVAILNGPPITERRFLLAFPERAHNVDRPGLIPGLLGLLGATNIDDDSLEIWLSEWQEVYKAIPPAKAPPHLHPSRMMYYQRAFEAILAGEQPRAVLWPMLFTWTISVDSLPRNSSHLGTWQQRFTQLELFGEQAVQIRMEALDAYLDLIDETLRDWARRNGVWGI